MGKCDGVGKWINMVGFAIRRTLDNLNRKVPF